MRKGILVFLTALLLLSLLPRASAEGEPELVLSHLEAVRTLFAPAAFCLPGPACLRNWAPLPLFQFSPDHF